MPIRHSLCTKVPIHLVECTFVYNLRLLRMAVNRISHYKKFIEPVLRERLTRSTTGRNII